MRHQTFIITIILLLISSSIHAQLFLQIKGGYNLNFLPDELDFGNSISLDQTGITRTIVRHSYGSGISIGGIVEYKLTDVLLVGMGLSYLSGAEKKVTNFGFSSTSTSTKNSSIIRITPQLSYTFFSHKKWHFRGNIAFVLGVDGTIIEKTIIAGSSSVERDIISVKEGGLSVGVQTGLEAIFAFKPKVDLYLGFRLIGQSYAPKTREITLYLENGVDKLDDLSAYERYGKYVKQFVSGSGGGNINEPSIGLKKNYAFSSVGIMAGIRYQL